MDIFPFGLHICSYLTINGPRTKVRQLENSLLSIFCSWSVIYSLFEFGWMALVIMTVFLEIYILTVFLWFCQQYFSDSTNCISPDANVCPQTRWPDGWLDGIGAHGRPMALGLRSPPPLLPEPSVTAGPPAGHQCHHHQGEAEPCHHLARSHQCHHHQAEPCHHLATRNPLWHQGQSKREGPGWESGCFKRSWSHPVSLHQLPVGFRWK